MKNRFSQYVSDSSGMTFIEIMVVVAIIAAVTAVGATIVFPGNEAKLNEEAAKLVGTIKYTHNEAIIKNQYYRMVFDFANNTYSVESSEVPFLVEMEMEQKNKEAPPTETTFSTSQNRLMQPKKMPSGIKIRDIFVFHEKGLQNTGKQYAYFLPNGWMEPLVINLSDENEEQFISVEVNPLTGNSKIRESYFQPDFEKDAGGPR